LAASAFITVPEDESWLLNMYELAEVCAFLRDGPRAETLVSLLAPYETRVVTGLAIVFGAVAHVIGLLETVLARWDDAARHFDLALGIGRLMEARPWVARTQSEYARMLLLRGREGDCEQARNLLDAALTSARALDMPILSERLQALEKQWPGVGWGTPVETASPPEPRHATADFIWRRTGDFWTLAYGGSVAQLKDSKGMQYLAQLLRSPGQELAAVDLVAGVGEHPSSDGNRGSEAVLDSKARATYKARLVDLRDELQEAEDAHDLGRIERTRAEIEFISLELAAAVGLGGRDRLGGSAAERARSTVTKGIKSAIEKIGAANPRAGRYFTRTIRTGFLCSYQPDPDERITWEF
jgi:hypothetical protein